MTSHIFTANVFKEQLSISPMSKPTHVKKINYFIELNILQSSHTYVKSSGPMLFSQSLALTATRRVSSILKLILFTYLLRVYLT